MANGNNVIGMGHIMRCKAIAESLHEKGVQIEFISKYEQGCDYLEKSDIKTIKYFLQEDLSNILKTNKYDFAVIDTYEVNQELFSVFKANVNRVIYIDDLNLFDYNADIIINTAIKAKELGYSSDKEKQYLLGSDYCILRKEFRNGEKHITEKDVSNILITTGGSDSKDMTCFFLNTMLEAFKEVNYHVIVGQAFENKDKIMSFAKFPNVKIYNSPGNMAQIMLKCDMAVSAGGNTLYELCALNIPTISFIYADNQKKFVQNFEEVGCVKNIGFYADIDSKRFIEQLKLFIEDYIFRKNMVVNQSKLVDGNGVERITEHILKKG